MTTLTAMLLSAMRTPAGTTESTTVSTPAVVTPVTTPVPTPTPSSLETRVTEEIVIKNNLDLNKKKRELAANTGIISTAESQANAVLTMNRNYFAMQTINPVDSKPYADYNSVPDATKPVIDAMVIEMVWKSTGMKYEDIDAYLAKMTEDNIKTAIENSADYKNLLRAMKIAAEMD